MQHFPITTPADLPTAYWVAFISAGAFLVTVAGWLVWQWFRDHWDRDHTPPYPPKDDNA